MSDTATKAKKDAIVEFTTSPANESSMTKSLNKGDTSYWLEINPTIKDHDKKFHEEKKIELLIKQELLNRYK